MRWTEIPRDWTWDGDPEPINAEIRAEKGRRELNWNDVANILGLKRQALARRLHGETAWRYSEFRKLADAWPQLQDFLYENGNTPT